MDIKQYFPDFVKEFGKEMRSRLQQMPTKGRVRKLIQACRPIWLEIGASSKSGRRGWITLDLSPSCDLCWDLRRGLPFPDQSVEIIYSSHTFEHFFPRELQILLAECKRVMITGGVLSVAVPDARIWISAYTKGEAIDSRKYLNGYQVPLPYGRLDLVNFIAYMDGCHKYLFDDENLLNVLLTAGFRNVQLRPFDPMIDVAVRQHESIYAQCNK